MMYLNKSIPRFKDVSDGLTELVIGTLADVPIADHYQGEDIQDSNDGT